VIPRAGGSVVKAPPPPSTASGPSGAASLALELTLLDAARGALDGGDPARALALLDQYTREFPLGRLAPEARVMRIEATARRGDRAAAQSMAREFLDDSPESPHADRVRKLGAMDGGVSNP
jgi:TolA-binding protein